SPDDAIGSGRPDNAGAREHARGEHDVAKSTSHAPYASKLGRGVRFGNYTSPKADPRSLPSMSNWFRTYGFADILDDLLIGTYLHCRAGWQRSAAVAAGVVALRDGLDIDEALDFVRRRKPSADPLPHQREDLRRWWLGRREAARD